MNSTTSIKQLKSIGPKLATVLTRLGVKTVRDLLYYFPFRYEDLRRIMPMDSLVEGEMVTVRGKLELIANKRSFRKRLLITEALVSDASGSARVVWFNQPFLIKTLHPGDTLFLSGKVARDMLGPHLTSPVYEKEQADSAPTHTGRLVPMYPLTAGITQKQIRFLLKQCIPLAESISDWLPEDIQEKNKLELLPRALQQIHFPDSPEDLAASSERLKFDELLLIQIQAELSRLKKNVTHAPSIAFKENEVKNFVAHLPFALTRTQKIAAWEIVQDLQKSTPMNRLLSGDVGSGKTVVAALELYNTFLNGFQSALMVPTEILAAQHFASLKELLGSYGVRIGLFTRGQKMITQNDESISKKKFLDLIEAGELDIIIGTQALLGENVAFKKLALVIVDEQHRFGVSQRHTIKEKGENAHFLSMTATPIPRSLALALYGDLDVSIINELPPGRKKISTKLVAPAGRESAYQFIREEVKKGRQVFVICSLIEKALEKDVNKDEGEMMVRASEVSDKKSVLSEYERLSKTVFPDLRVGYVHGKMKAKEKEEIMGAFNSGALDILISTSMIEVGVNVPNASVMMIEDADRFGLAQLHQFRGRVGRSEYQSYCLLFTNSFSARARERLQFFEAHNDGFKLAEKDLEQRGPGEVYGTEQSGLMQLRLAKLTDHTLIKKAREAALVLAPRLAEYPLMLERVREWGKEVHLE